MVGKGSRQVFRPMIEEQARDISWNEERVYIFEGSVSAKCLMLWIYYCTDYCVM